MIDLTTEQRQQLEGSGPVEVRDPVTNETYFLVRKVAYERIRSLLDEDAEWADGAYCAAMEVFARDGWDDPRMDVYDALDPRKTS
jgi:hypothetical protein